MNIPELTPEERAIYEWQMWVPGFGEEGQRKLKGATVFVSRIGGLGGLVAYQLAAAGIGHLILAHAGNIKPSDLNRQLLMSHNALGTSRLESAKHRLHELNPQLQITTIPENASVSNAAQMVASADVVVCCVPMFEERLALNAECVKQRKPMIDCAMYELTGQLTTIIPGRTACVACRVPTPPTNWKREFPVFGAVSGTVGCMGAMEAIKVLTGLGEPLLDRLLTFDLRDMRFRTIQTQRRRDCAVCSEIEV
jgi:molybdopterin-synthase adenylyltransferase